MTTFHNKFPTKHLEWLGSVLGLSGATLFTSNLEFTKFGHILFILSGLVFLAFGYRKQYQALLPCSLDSSWLIWWVSIT